MTSDGPSSGLPAPTAEQRRQAALHFDRASTLVAKGEHLAGIRLLMECCALEPGNLLYRQALRRAEKARFANNLKGGRFAWLLSWPLRRRLRAARAAGRYLEVLRLGERVLVRNPWEVPTQMEMAAAADVLGLLDVAVWLLEQARHKEPQGTDLNRRLARLYERRGNFTQALALWELVQKAAPDDEEARRKLALAAAPASPSDQLARALREARERLDAAPAQPAGYLDLARLQRQAGQLGEARKVLLDGLAATAQAFELSVELAELEIEPFRRDLSQAQQRLASTPDDAGLLHIQHELRREINTRELEVFRKLADRYPGRPVYRYEVGVRLLRAGLLAEAAEELRAVHGDPALRGEALAALAHGYRGRQNLRQAVRCYEEALACLPGEPAERRKAVVYELALCHAELGDLPRAVALAADLARLDPGHRDIGQLLHQWRERAKDVPAS